MYRILNGTVYLENRQENWPADSNVNSRRVIWTRPVFAVDYVGHVYHMRTQGAFVGQKKFIIRTPETGLERWRELGGFGKFGKILPTPLLAQKTIFWNKIKSVLIFFFLSFSLPSPLAWFIFCLSKLWMIMNIKDSFAFSPGE